MMSPAVPEALDTFGKRLRMWRKRSGMTLMDLSQKVGASQSALSEVENDKSLPSAETLTGFCLNTEVDIFWLLTGRVKEGVGQYLRDSSMQAAEAQNEKPAEKKDMHLQSLLDCLVRIYRDGDHVKRAHLEGFLRGADPGANR